MNNNKQQSFIACDYKSMGYHQYVIMYAAPQKNPNRTVT